MQLEPDTGFSSLGYWSGYLAAYAMFTTLLTIILTLLGKLPFSWSALHVATITLGIVILAKLVRRLL